MIDILLKLLLAAACAAILWRAEPALNRMSPCTPARIRYAMLLIAAGALYAIAELIAGASASPPLVVLAWGILILLTSERRLRHLLNRHPGDRHHAT